MSVMDALGKDYRSAFGLPVINIPGCAPIGDNFTETVFAILLFLQGLGPLPAFDEDGRPAWMFGKTVHQGCTRAGFYEEGTFAEQYGDPERLVEIGCWGRIVNCNIVERGAINHMGGCMRAGGVCIGGTMPGFPDKFSPFYKTPPGAIISTTFSRGVGSVIRRLRRLTNRHGNTEVRWDVAKEVPSGWGHVGTPNALDRTVHFFYEVWQRMGARKPGRRPGEEARFWGVDRPGLKGDYVDESVTRHLWLALLSVVAQAALFGALAVLPRVDPATARACGRYSDELSGEDSARPCERSRSRPVAPEECAVRMPRCGT
jgi:uncharacterized protein YbdZ (MbtH family)